VPQVRDFIKVLMRGGVASQFKVDTHIGVDTLEAAGVCGERGCVESQCLLLGEQG